MDNEYDKMEPVSVISYIVAKFGKQILASKKRTIGLFYDLAPDLNAERKNLALMFDIGAVNLLLQAEEMSDMDKMVAIANSKQLFHDNSGVDDEWIKFNISLITNALNWQILKDPDELRAEARNDLKSKKYDSAYMKYSLAAKLGNYEAMASVGRMVLQGYVDVPIEEGLNHIRTAAINGNARARMTLFDEYENGEHINVDSRQAMFWLKKAADQGHGTAEHELGYRYFCGKKCEQNFDLSIMYLERSFQKGINMSASLLGLVYHIVGREEEALQCFITGSQRNEPVSMSKYGEALLFGSGISKDVNKAFSLIKESADKGTSSALYLLGYCYENGLGCTQNLGLAEDTYIRSIQDDDDDSKYAYGKMILEKRSIRGTTEEAINYMMQATDNENINAIAFLSKYLYENKDKYQDKLIGVLKQGVSLRIPVSFMYLGLCYCNGIAITKDDKEGIELLKRAEVEGVLEASKYLTEHSNKAEKKRSNFFKGLFNKGE